MNEETTRELPDRASFEQRVFARFDSIDARFDGVEARLEKLESHSYETKPIWERALKEILETQLEVGVLKSKIEGIETKVEAIEMKIEQLVESQRDFKVKITRRIDLTLEVMVDNRDAWRNSDARLSQLESRLA